MVTSSVAAQLLLLSLAFSVAAPLLLLSVASSVAAQLLLLSLAVPLPSMAALKTSPTPDALYGPAACCLAPWGAPGAVSASAVATAARNAAIKSSSACNRDQFSMSVTECH